MRSAASYWFPLILVFLSWETALWRPQWLIFAFGACLLGIVLFILPLVVRNKEGIGSRDYTGALSVVVALSGVFWWLLWIDLRVVKFFIPFLLFVAASMFFSQERRMTKQARLAIYVGGTFFWAHFTYGLVTVLGWDPWRAAGMFIIAFILLSWPLFSREEHGQHMILVVWLTQCLFAIEAYSVLVWLPFAESTLALLLTIFMAGLYDFSKYVFDPSLVRRSIVLKKILVYVGAFSLLLISTPWH